MGKHDMDEIELMAALRTISSCCFRGTFLNGFIKGNKLESYQRIALTFWNSKGIKIRKMKGVKIRRIDCKKA